MKLYEVEIETPRGRYLHVLVAAPSEDAARRDVRTMIADFEPALSGTLFKRANNATVKEVQVNG